MLTASLSELPPFLTADSGLNNGYMIAQYTAAALVSENKVLCHPASVDSIPSSGDQEDHVSMGMTAAVKLLQVAAQPAADPRHRGALRGPGHRPAGAAGPARHAGGLRAGPRAWPATRQDRYLAPEIEAVAAAVEEGRFAEIVRSQA